MDDNTEDDSSAFETIVAFETMGDKTLLTMRSIFATAEARDFAVREFGAIEGGNQTIISLEEFLTKFSK